MSLDDWLLDWLTIRRWRVPFLSWTWALQSSVNPEAAPLQLRSSELLLGKTWCKWRPSMRICSWISLSLWCGIGRGAWRSTPTLCQGLSPCSCNPARGGRVCNSARKSGGLAASWKRNLGECEPVEVCGAPADPGLDPHAPRANLVSRRLFWRLPKQKQRNNGLPQNTFVPRRRQISNTKLRQFHSRVKNRRSRKYGGEACP